MPSPTQRRGTLKERLAARWLEEDGYVILHRNWRGGGGEVDLIATQEDLLCFIEVRSRADDHHGLPMETVDHRKQAKLIRAARAYLTRFPPGRSPMVRFDVVSILDGSPIEITVIKNAFEARE